MIDETGTFTEEFTEKLPEMLGDEIYNDPDTRQQKTKVFDNIKDLRTLTLNHLRAERKISSHGEELKKATEGLTKIPGEGSSPEEVTAYRKAIGVPETKDGYELSIPKVETDKAGYEAIAKEVREAAHTAGIPASKLSAVWNTVINGLIKQTTELEQKGIDLMEKDTAALKEKHKEKYDSFMKDGEDALAKFENGPEVAKLLDSFGIKGHPIVREFLYEVAPLVLEGGTHLGGGQEEKGKEEGGMPVYDDEYFENIDKE